MSRLEIDFYEELEMPKPIVCGLVNKILSPKGIRKLNKNDLYEYHLKSELTQVYDGKAANVDKGIYWVMDIYRRVNELKWNHYLVIVEDDCFYPIAEFLDCHDSTWIKDAIPYIKAYFAGDEQDPIDITPYKPPKQRKTGWSTKK